MKKSQPKRLKTVAFVQTRMGSTRFPGKVLHKIGGREIFLVQLDRMKHAKKVDQIVVVTTIKKRDDVIAELCRKNKILCFRGSEADLLDRHYKAAKKYKADIALKIPSDEPLIDGEIIDEVADMMLANMDKYDFVSNLHPPSYPDGLDVEAIPFKTLEKTWKEAKQQHEREMVTPYIWDNPDKFRIGVVVNKRGNMFMDQRWTLDYPADFEFFKAVYAAFKNKKYFLMDDILAMLKKHPEIKTINAKFAGINWYRHVNHLLKTVDRKFYRLDKAAKQV